VVVVREQRERQLVLLFELHVRLLVVGRHAQHDRTLALEFAVDVADPARLGGTAGGVVLRVEVEDDLLAAEVGQLDRLAGVARQLEIFDHGVLSVGFRRC
jgi:hypothetical protein